MKLNPKKTAFLTLDFQKGIFENCHGAEDAVSKAARAAEFAREHGFFLIHVGLGFSEGHPEIPDFDSPFLKVKQSGLFAQGSPSAEFLPTVVKDGELVIYKQRIAAFTENHLDLVLRSQGIGHLVFFGLTTSGIVLSTQRRAFDLNYQCVILKDACFDHDEEVHRVLTGKIFPRLATVTTVDAFIAGQEG